MDSEVELYQWQEDEHRALRERGLSQHRLLKCNYNGRVRVINFQWVVKSVDKQSPEARTLAALMELKDMRSKQNHTIPAELVDCSKTIVVIMPFLMVIESVTWWQFPLNVLFESMSNLIEGLKFMHGQHIAHVDIHTTNAVFSENNVVAGDFKIPRFKTFYIDFGSSRYIPPGADPVIQDYEERGGHYDPPQGLNDVDVFAYDVFALGSLFKDMIEHAGRYSPHRGHIPRSVSLFTEKLTCDQDIHRPNIRQTQAVWTELHRRIKLQSNRVWLSHEQRLAAEIHSWEQVAKLFRL